MLIKRISRQLQPEQAAALIGTFLDDTAYDWVVREDADVYAEDTGEPLIKFRRHAIAPALCRQAYPCIRKAARTSDNRGAAAGYLEEQDPRLSRPVGERTRTRYRPVLLDGRLSNTSYAAKVESGIMGFYDRYPRIPYCRETAFNITEPHLFQAAIPYMQAIDQVFAREMPDRYAAQKAMVAKTHPDFLISGTAFTTVTVNRNFRTAVHTDQGDLKAGFGVMSVLEGGKYDGGLLIFPAYRVAVDMRTGDVCLANVHEWHGNTAIKGRTPLYERITCVFYYREKMVDCGSAVEERVRARQFSESIQERRLKGEL